MSRGWVKGYERARPRGSTPVPTALHDSELAELERLAMRGLRDRQIADALGLNESRVCYWRQKLGIAGIGNRGSHQDALALSVRLRPRHVIGECGDDDWWRSNNDGFVQAVLQAGGW